MRRLFFVLVLALGALGALAGGAARASGFQNINPYHCPSGIGVGFAVPGSSQRPSPVAIRCR